MNHVLDWFARRHHSILKFPLAWTRATDLQLIQVSDQSRGVTKSQAFRAHDVTCNMRTGAAPLMHSIAAQYERVPKLA